MRKPTMNGCDLFQLFPVRPFFFFHLHPLETTLCLIIFLTSLKAAASHEGRSITEVQTAIRHNHYAGELFQTDKYISGHLNVQSWCSNITAFDVDKIDNFDKLLELSRNADISYTMMLLC